MNRSAPAFHAHPRILAVLRATGAVLALASLIGFGTVGYNVAPVYYWFMIAALLPAAAYLLLRRAAARARVWAEARKRWSEDGFAIPRVRYARFEALRGSYVDATRDESRGFVDDRTWDDLAMDEICDQMDVCFTIAGRNEIYRTLRHATPEESGLRRRREQIDRFLTNVPYREANARLLAGIGEEPDADPASILFSDALRRDRLYPLFITMAVLALFAIVITAVVQPAFGLVCIVAVFLVNMWIYYRKARHISLDIPALRVLSRMMRSARRMPIVLSDPQVTGGARGAFRWLLTGSPTPTPSFSGDIVEMIFTYIKIYFQIDLIAYGRIIGHITAHRQSYRELYQAVGSLDAAFALAAFRSRTVDACDAEILDQTEIPGGPGLHLEGAYHPLVPHAVPNSINLRRPGAIITGTNMAGKSTFLRTVGINVLVAQTAGFAFAASYRGARLSVLSSINKRDDLAAGKSFYYDEAERIFRLIEGADGDVPALLLIDELLSGTNSLEREGASLAILHYLAKHNALTVAATHDIAIATGVGDLYELHYFTDRADKDGLSFDYKLQPGVVQSRNAIKLLRLIGYPEDVVRAALERTDPDTAP